MKEKELKQLSVILNGTIDEVSLEKNREILLFVKDFFKITIQDLAQILNKSPTLLGADKQKVKRNLEELSKNLDVRSREFYLLLIKTPAIILMPAKRFVYQLRLLMETFGVSAVRAMHYLFVYPTLLSITKDEILNKIAYYAKKLNEYGINCRKFFRREPMLFYSSQSNLEKIKNLFMRKYTLTEEEVQKVIKAVPAVVTCDYNKIAGNFEQLYPEYFIKRDIKEMLAECPEFVSVETEVCFKKLKEIQDLFGVDKKKACEIIRKNPNLIFYESVDSKVSQITGLGISKEYIAMFPAICNVPQIALALKFVITRVLRLDSEFSEVCVMDTNLFVARFVFMQTNKIFNHKDLILEQSKFEMKYHISREELNSYKLTEQSLKNLCNYYLSLKGKLVGWKDIPFPNFDHILKYLYSYTIVPREEVCQSQIRLKVIGSKMKELGICQQETEMVVKKCPALLFFINDCFGVINILKKYMFTNEEIVKLLFNKPSLFCMVARDFEVLLGQIVEDKKCTYQEAVKIHM